MPATSLGQQGKVAVGHPLLPLSQRAPRSQPGAAGHSRTPLQVFSAGQMSASRKGGNNGACTLSSTPRKKPHQPQKGRATASHEHCKCFQQIALRTTGAVKHRKLEGKRGEGRFANLVSPLENDQNLHF